ncbi:hypothetical protein [uncultured Oscillibacter sp.]|uniref:hypothetical protein n=2 Tax=uncultured Oscillibacter sp. TaxID=876091 RepID=UPI00260967B7|nr:hypothetical protein [uncultured Oscillibacter sp.]
MANGISIKIDDELLRNIHVRAARKGVSVQRYMNSLIERDLFPERFSQLTEEQIQQLKTALELVNQALEGAAAHSELVESLAGEPTMLQCVNQLNRMFLFPEQFPQLTAEQTEQLRDAMDAIDRAIEDVNDILWNRPEQNIKPPGMTLGG